MIAIKILFDPQKIARPRIIGIERQRAVEGGQRLWRHRIVFARHNQRLAQC